MTQETFEQMVVRVADEVFLKPNGVIEFASRLRDELENGQEPVAHFQCEEHYTGKALYTQVAEWANGDSDVIPLYARPFVAAPAGVPDFEPDAKRLALELECLLLECKDMAAVSKWWDSSHEALEQHRALLSADYSAPADAVVKDAEAEYAIKESRRINSCEEYFGARPQIDCLDRRRVFEAGFDRGYDAAMQGKESGNV